jgi:hypothetical protein
VVVCVVVFVLPAGQLYCVVLFEVLRCCMSVVVWFVDVVVVCQLFAGGVCFSFPGLWVAACVSQQGLAIVHYRCWQHAENCNALFAWLCGGVFCCVIFGRRRLQLVHHLLPTVVGFVLCVAEN